ncbi:MAG: response regulator [Planctomycetes bacterium]|nr:response regulator [Planctomycetota bacterium]
MTKPQILMLEDNEHDVLLLREAAADSGFAVEIMAVGSCLDAVAFLERVGKYRNACKPDLILVDLNLPMDHGTQLLAFLKKSEPHRAIPALVYSSSSSEQELTARMPAEEFLLKPDNFEGFARVLDRLKESLPAAAT